MKQANPSSERAVIIHGQAHALAAITEARGAGSPLLLLSAPSAACYLGPGWWLALMAAIAPQLRRVSARDLLDCGASAGRAMEALRLGVPGLILSRTCPQFEAVQARAAAAGIIVETEPPEALDLAGKNATRQLRNWLHTGRRAP